MANKKEKNANYDFEKQVEPKRRMGAGSFANLPDRPIYANYGGPSLRDGITNSFTCNIDDVSGIDENER